MNNFLLICLLEKNKMRIVGNVTILNVNILYLNMLLLVNFKIKLYKIRAKYPIPSIDGKSCQGLEDYRFRNIPTKE